VPVARSQFGCIPSRPHVATEELRRSILGEFGTWRSLVARLLGVQEVPGSNPGVPTIDTYACLARSPASDPARFDSIRVASNTNHTILLTNDDGVEADGLEALRHARRYNLEQDNTHRTAARCWRRYPA
jgi:hypothetical protein